jgi:hypothetical protein
MTLDAMAQSPAGVGSRFWRVAYLPTYATLLYLLVLVWAGAPGHWPRFSVAWRTATGLGVIELLLITLAVVLVAVLFQPLQLALVRLLEGGIPTWLGAGPARAWQRRRRDALTRAATLPWPATPAQVHTAGVAGSRLRERFPIDEHLLRPTGLGNALTAMEDLAGRTYGLDAVVAWPRLYPLLGPPVKAIVDDRRDTLDGAARLAVSAAVACMASAGLLAVHGGPWLLLPLAPAAAAVVAYHGAVQAAIAFGEAVHVAFDLHRGQLFDAMRADAATPAAEAAAGRQLSDLWRQGVPPDLEYRPRKEPS